MFFGHVGGGANGGATVDLNSLFGGRNFDTVNAGPKLNETSYERIAEELGKGPTELLFLSDNVHEVRAAIRAGMHAVVVDRPGNAPLSEQDRHELKVIASLDQVEL